MTILSNAVSVAFSHAALVAGVDVTYVRGETELEITAIAGTQTVLQASEYANLIQKRHRESFLVKPSDLIDTFTAPQAGDKIKYTPPNRTDIELTFTLRPDDGDGQVYRPTDRYHTRWRLNTILTDQEAA